MIGFSGDRRATSTNPAAAKVDTIAGARGTRRDGAVEGIRLDRRRAPRPGEIERAVDQRGGHALTTVTLTHVEAADHPHRHVVDASRPPTALDRRNPLPRRDLAPAHRVRPLKREEAGWRTLSHQSAEIVTIGIRRPSTPVRPDAGGHAPAPAGRPALIEQVRERRPEPGGQRLDHELPGGGLHRPSLSVSRSGPTVSAGCLAEDMAQDSNTWMKRIASRDLAIGPECGTNQTYVLSNTRSRLPQGERL